MKTHPVRGILAASLFGLGLLTVAGGCAGSLQRVPLSANLRPSGPPSVRKAQDLGSLPLPGAGPLSLAHADDLFTPGEYVALYGENLTPGSQVVLSGRAAAVVGAIDGGLLIQVPRGISTGRQVLRIDNGLGTAEITVSTAFYAFGGDAAGNGLRIRRLGPEGEQPEMFDDKPLDIAFPLSRYQSLSYDGALLFALAEPATDEAPESSSGEAITVGTVVCDLMVVHMGAKHGPQEVTRVPLSLVGKPTGLVMGPAGQLVVLQPRQITVVDVSIPQKPQPVVVLPLWPAEQKRELVDAEFLGDGRLLAVLEAYANQIHLIDIGGPRQPRLVSGVSLSPEYEQPFSIDLAPGPDPSSMWVLQGPNLRLAGKRLLDGLSGAWRDAKALDVKGAAKTLGQTAVGAAMLPSEPLTRVQLVQLVGGQLQVVKSLPLPSEIFPFFIQPDYRGSLFVSGVNRKNQFSSIDASLDGVRRLLGAIKDTTQLGVILKVGTEDGSVATAVQGVAMYYDLALLPSGQLMTSTIRLGPGYIPPRVTLDWGFEVPGKSFAKLREVANTGFKITDVVRRLLPPYRYERIGVQ